MTAHPTTQSPHRTYGQYCPVAVGLDVLGDRWVLLIFRELAFGPRRFTQLRRALPGIAPNLLSGRLRQMQKDGIVKLTPSGQQYELTDLTDEIRPIIRALAKFGVRYLDTLGPEQPAPAEFDAFHITRGFLGPWISCDAAPLRTRVHTTDGTAVELVAYPGGYDLDDELSAEPDVEFWTDLWSLERLRRTGRPLPLRKPGGAPALRGDLAAVRAFVAAFELVFETPRPG